MCTHDARGGESPATGLAAVVGADRFLKEIEVTAKRQRTIVNNRRA